MNSFGTVAARIAVMHAPPFEKLITTHGRANVP
jgi:hypothetical protein